jgi:hypothetical protein
LTNIIQTLTPAGEIAAGATCMPDGVSHRRRPLYGKKGAPRGAHVEGGGLSGPPSKGEMWKTAADVSTETARPHHHQ